MDFVLSKVNAYLEKYSEFYDALKQVNKFEIGQGLTVTNDDLLFSVKNEECKSVGSRMIIFPHLISYLLYDDFVSYGHSGLRTDYIGKGLGIQLYNGVDAITGINSSPSCSPCCGKSTSVFAKKMWNKIANTRVVTGYSNLEEYSQERVDKYNGLYHFLDASPEHIQTLERMSNDIDFLKNEIRAAYKDSKYIYRDLDNHEIDTIIRDDIDNDFEKLSVVIAENFSIPVIRYMGLEDKISFQPDDLKRLFDTGYQLKF